jgi:transcription initiation factor TFIIIB Brf1 subunit/transcription initiation factor TFIIB
MEGELDSTIIGKLDGGSGASMNLSKTQVKVVGKAQKNLLNAFKQIDIMCDGIGLSRIVKDSAKQFFKKVIQSIKLRSMKKNCFEERELKALLLHASI